MSLFHFRVTALKERANPLPLCVLAVCHLSLLCFNTFEKPKKAMQTVCNFILHFCFVLLKTF